MTDLGSFATTDLTKTTKTGIAKRTGDIDVNWVQLWEYGPKWAEYNVGAATNSPVDFGGGYLWSADNDIATTAWGSNWRLPTKIEFEALIANCNCTWTENYNGTSVNGLLCEGKEGTACSGNKIFLPATLNDGILGNYWSSTLNPTAGVFNLHFSRYKEVFVEFNNNSWYYPVRPVLAQ